MGLYKEVPLCRSRAALEAISKSGVERLGFLLLELHARLRCRFGRRVQTGRARARRRTGSLGECRRGL